MARGIGAAAVAIVWMDCAPGGAEPPPRRIPRDAVRDAHTLDRVRSAGSSNVTVTIREATTDGQLDTWRRVRTAVLPGERCPTIGELRAMATTETVYIVAELDGRLAGSGALSRSDFGYASLHPRVLPGMRRRGVGTTLLNALAARAIAAGFSEAGSEADDSGSLAFARRFGFHEVDRQVEQIRTIGDEPIPTIPGGIQIVTAAERPELWPAAYKSFGAQAISDMATYRPIAVSREQWERDWLSWPDAMFLALDGETVVGCAGLERDDDRPELAEHAFTAVSRSWRRRGLASALKRMTLVFASQHGIREVYTWTQARNADMRALNERLGYRAGRESITVRGPLPMPAVD
jgi:mycothiol synthase